MSYLDGGAWPEPPLAGDEASAMLGALERLRATLAWKTAGLDADGLRATLPPSTITLGGLLKHLALIEDNTFSTKFLGRELGPPWDTVDWDADPDWEWHSAGDDTPDELHALWRAAVGRSRAAVDEALAAGGLGTLGNVTFGDRGPANLRRVVMDLVEEYGRHVGHADLIRQSVDGLVGEDPDL